MSSFARKSLAFRRESREGSRRKVRRPNSSTGVRGVTTNGTEEMVSTCYIESACMDIEFSMGVDIVYLFVYLFVCLFVCLFVY